MYDGAGRIKEYIDTDPSQKQTFMYHADGALLEFTRGGAAPTTYILDANGNRKSVTGPQGTDDYTYDQASNRLNRLLRITGAHPKTYRYDDAGNVESDGTNQFVYDGRGRLIQVTNAQGTTQYRINGLGQRVTKEEAQTVSHFVYDEAGHLLGEYTPEGQPVQETVYLDDMPVAVLKDGMTFFVYPDHLWTPRGVVDAKGKVLWRWDSDPFGATPPNEDPDGDRKTFTYNLRFPGQYFDQETGLVYNYFRDYDPQTGRYLQADPIGLAGGMNPYSYVEGNPLTNYDPYGLFDWADLPLPSQRTVDFSAGLGDVLLFGFGDELRDLFSALYFSIEGEVNMFSGEYSAGEWAGFILSQATGFSGGVKAAGFARGTAGGTREFSHFIPTRLGGSRSIWNGNYVSNWRHYKHDPFRYSKVRGEWRNWGPKWPHYLQQLDRIPNVFKGIVGGHAYGRAGRALAGPETSGILPVGPDLTRAPTVIVSVSTSESLAGCR